MSLPPQLISAITHADTSSSDDVPPSMVVSSLLAALPAISRNKNLRQASINLISTAPANDAGSALEQFAKHLPVLQATDYGLALQWTDTVLAHVKPADHAANEQLVANLLITQGTLLARALVGVAKSHQGDQHRLRMRRALLHHSKRATSALSFNLRTELTLDPLVKTLLAANGDGLLALALLVAGAHEDAQASFVTEEQLAPLQKNVAEAWCAAVLSAKPAEFTDRVAPLLQSTALDPLLTSYCVPQSVFDAVFVPNLSRALLRAPENIVDYVLPAVMRASAPARDFSELARAPALLSSLGSSNANLRASTAREFGEILRRSAKIDAGPLLAAFKRATSSESRSLYASVLAQVPSTQQPSDWASALAAQAAKEGAESALPVLADSLVALVPNESAVSAIKRGLQDARKPLKREWVLSLAASGLNEPEIALFQSELQSIWTEIVGNVNAAAAAKLAPAAFGLVKLLAPLGLDLRAVPSQLFGARVVDALVSVREQQLLTETSARLIADAEASAPEILRAFVHSTTLGPAAQQQISLKTFSSVFSEPKITDAQLRALVTAISSYAAETNRSVARVVHSVRSKAWLLAAFVLAHEPLASTKGGWIQLCLDTSEDPHAVVSAHLEPLFSAAVVSETAPAFATLAFVAPELVAPKLTAMFDDVLTCVPLSEKDLAILASPEGQLVSSNSAAASSRPAKPRAHESDEAWEARLRQELAAKHGQLTPAEQEELALQTARRQAIAQDAKRIAFACDVLENLVRSAAAGAENGILQWLPNGLVRCLAIVQHKAAGADAASACLSQLSVCLSSRFQGAWKQRTAALVLQGRHAPLPEVTRMLYMLNPVSDKRRLDPLSLVYILPILLAVLQNYDGAVESEEADEAVLLCTSLLANQAEGLAQVPRGELISVLLDLLAKFAADRHAVKDCLRSLAQRVAFDDAELQMLLDASLAAPQSFVKSAALEIVDAEIDLSHKSFVPEIWIARFGEFGEIAREIWDESGFALPKDGAIAALRPFFASQYASERAALAQAFTAAARLTDTVGAAYTAASTQFIERQQPPKPVINSFGLEVKQRWTDPYLERVSLLHALIELTPYLASAAEVTAMAEFVVVNGVTDKHPEVAHTALELGKCLVNAHGPSHVDSLLPVFERAHHIILFGFAAQHLPSTDPRLRHTVQTLLDALLTASDAESNIIIGSISPLAPQIDYAPVMAATLDQVFNHKTTEGRRGAAFGFAGLARGVGLRALGDLSIVNAICGAVEDKKSVGRREGAQWLVHALAQAYGPLFEPYALELMSEVLAGLGDGVPEVREVAHLAAKSIMAHTSSFGIKKQIPMALEQLDDHAWRTKKGAVELLGSMAFLSPQQLAASLATIVPEIASLLNDSHKEVRSSAKKAMKNFGQVIVNPEIHRLVPTLLAAISDPTSKTDEALSALLKTRFMHYIDTPSLALIIFVVQRGLRDRSANIKHKACQIVGNMSILTAGRDLIPYLPAIMPDLQVAMTDPVQQTSAVACKALGVLVEKLGEEYFPNVIPDLLEQLQTNDPREYGNRWGTAQGLAEVLHGLGPAKLDEVLPTIVQNCQSPVNHIRQGFAPLLLLLPGSFGPSLTPFLAQLVPPLLRGLADPLEDVREHALKAGRRIVRGYAAMAVDLLLPELERGLGNASWRIRLASVELVGDLLMELLGKQSQSDLTDRLQALAVAPGDDEARAEHEQAAQAAEESAANQTDANSDQPYTEANLKNLEVLGVERRDRVLAAIFVCRADIVGAVRQAALDTWLALIQNTPRAVKLILPTLVVMLLRKLGDEDEELQTNAARALAELVRRVSGALKLILPTFVAHLPDPEAREGICLGLVELIPATPVAALQEHERELMHLVRSCLQDSSTAVREAATRALEELHAALGDVAGDMLPEMVSQIVEDSDEGALAAVKEMLASTGASSVLAAALPALLRTQLTEFHANAIAELCLAASAADIAPYVTDVVDALIPTDYLAALDAVLAHECPESHLLSLVKNDELLRARVFGRMASFYLAAPAVDPLFVADWTVFALHGLESEDGAESAVSLLRAITGSGALSKSELAKLVTPAFQTLQQLNVPVKPFSTAEKGPAFVLPIFLNGLVLGSNLEKEQSALAIAEIVKRTQPFDKLRPVVTMVTGPLIRIVGERTVPDVKASIIYTLNELLNAIPLFLKPFLPQLQRTFAKNLADPTSSVVRSRSALALSSLIKLQTRLDPLCKEIVTGVRSATDAGVRSAFLAALFAIVNTGGANLGTALREQVVELVNDPVLSEEATKDSKQMSLFAKIGASVVSLPAESGASADARSMAESLLHASHPLQAVLNANALLVLAPEVANVLAPELASRLESAANQSNPLISENGVVGLGKLLLAETSSNGDQLKPHEHSAVQTLVTLVSDVDGHSHEARRLCLVILNAFGERHHAQLRPFWDELAPKLFTAARDRNIPIKLAAEAGFRTLFDFANRRDSALFDEWFASAKDSLDARMQRSLPEYVRRVALRAVERDAESEPSEPRASEDLAEIWAIGVE